ncbi:MAG TPA: LacI family DNA-binding transcriptional regulator [Phycisphaerales bacterium]|nr:LacI family DNA-binding transcriptional regulator [Phycisphaerales bacterium]
MSRHDTSRARSRTTASIADVARAANVSIATVSRVFNSPDLVAAATTDRVLQAVRELGYQPNAIARALMTNRSQIIGIALPDIHGEFYSEILRGADSEARAHGLRLLIASEAREGEGAGSQTGLPYSLIDGLAVMITEPNQPLWLEARSCGVPVCVLDLEVAEPGVDNVLVDNVSGAREATQHLLARAPASRCYFVGGAEANFDSQQRARGFRTLVEQRAGPLRPEQIAFGDYTSEWGRRWAEENILARGLRASAVLAGNDEIAMGVLFAVREAGLRVPEDVAVVGFDNTRLCGIVRPTISSVRIPLRELGAMAIILLLRRIAEPDCEPQRVRLAAQLVARESS